MNITDGESYYWTTEEAHYDNIETMNDFLSYELSDEWEVCCVDGTYAEILCPLTGVRLSVHAAGNGDSYNHKVTFEKL